MQQQTEADKAINRAAVEIFASLLGSLGEGLTVSLGVAWLVYKFVVPQWATSFLAAHGYGYWHAIWLWKWDIAAILGMFLVGGMVDWMYKRMKAAK